MRRKVFRIEKSLASSRAKPTEAADTDHRHLELIGELKALRALAERRGEHGGDIEDLKRELEVIYDSIKSNQRELSAMQGDALDGSRIARAQQELSAVIGALGNATQSVLKAAERIDESARALSATLKGEYERGLAQDVQEQVARIYEGCNFHDIGGQRVANVMATLKVIEDHIDRVIGIWGGVEQPGRRNQAPPVSAGREFVNGPKLDGDAGHASQSEIDALFG